MFVVLLFLLLFLFNKKTAYEMRISDWRSDVCASDLEFFDAGLRRRTPEPSPDALILPDLDELLALRGAAQGLNLGERRAARAQIQGGNRSAQSGRGLEVEEVRTYAVGDDEIGRAQV